MSNRRSFDEHIVLFAAYGARVAQLQSASWDRLRERCADLNGPAFRSLVRRAFLAAKVYEMWLPEVARRIPSVQVIDSVSRFVQRGLALAGEVAAEFDAAYLREPEQPRRRTTTTGAPRSDAYWDAICLIESALKHIQRTDPGVATAVRAAGQAVLRHDRLAPADFETVYSFVEPEIPYAELDPPPAG